MTKTLWILFAPAIIAGIYLWATSGKTIEQPVINEQLEQIVNEFKNCLDNNGIIIREHTDKGIRKFCKIDVKNVPDIIPQGNLPQESFEIEIELP